MVSSGIRLVEGTEEHHTRTPAVGLLLAYASILPIVVGTTASFVFAPNAVTRLTIIWAGAVLCFLSGVRRGLAFRQPGGPTIGELATMLATFVLGVGALLSPWPVPALVLLLTGFAAVGLTDVRAARHQEAPAYFARLRPAQMAIPVVALTILLVRCAW